MQPYLCYGYNLIETLRCENNGGVSEHAFSGCEGITSLTLGEEVSSIGDYAFSGCCSLTAITIPKSVNAIGNYAFSGCTGLGTILMDDGNTELTLGSNGSSPLFAGCPLDSVYIGRNITYPTGSSKGYSPFCRNTSLRSVHISDAETEITPNEFYGCTNLKNVRLGDGITTIGDWAFSGCSSLDFFSFGSSVESIGKEAFSDCSTMTKLISKAAIPPICGTQALDDINKWECTLLVPDESLALYQAADQWKEFFFMDIDPDGIASPKSSPEGKDSPGEAYDLSGRQIVNGKFLDALAPRRDCSRGRSNGQMPRGINIIRMSDGSVRKILRKQEKRK
ncbi:MAG: leucine-rich repeat domain-containing protein [Bacteroidaceae bacterium]|nr:leucine-rich repeat domain-containing protein [Bacteroidaceae bacterium]